MNKEQASYLIGLAPKQDLTADKVVADAKRVDSPLHSLFDWNLKRAASAHWVERARELIRYASMTIQTTVSPGVTRTMVVPAFVRDPRVEPSKQGYITITKARDDKEIAREVILNETRYVLAALERAKLVADALDSLQPVDDLIKRVGKFRRDVEKRFPAGLVA